MLPKKYSNSALKVVTILGSFSKSETELSTTEISRKAGVPNSTVHYILASLTMGGLLIRDENNGKYSVGPKLFEIGSIYLRSMNLVSIAEPVVKALNDITDEQVSIGILNRNSLLRVLSEESKQELRYVVPIGISVPAYASAMGKALLSQLSDVEIDIMYPYEKLTEVTEHTIRTKTKLKLELENIRSTGISMNTGGAVLGVEGIAHVIRNSSGKAIGALSIALPIVRINEAKHQKLIELVKLGATLISYNLGFSDATSSVRNIRDVYNWWEQNHW